MKHLRKAFRYLGPYRSRIAIGISCVALGAFFMAALPWLAMKALGVLEEGNPDLGDLGFWIGALLVAAVIRGVFLFGARWYIITTSRYVACDLRVDLFRHLQTLNSDFYDRNKTGDIMSRAVADIEGVRMAIGFSLMQIGNTFFFLTFSIIGMLMISPSLTAIAVIPLFLCSFIVLYLARKIHRFSRVVQESLADVSSHAQQNFNGVRVVKAYSQENRQIDSFRSLNQRYRDNNVKLAITRAGLFSSMYLLSEFGVVLALWFGGQSMIAGTFTASALIGFTGYQFQLIWPMTAVGWVISLFQRGDACMERLQTIFETQPSVSDGPDVLTELPAPKGRIEVTNLTFQYPMNDVDALHDINFTVEPGHTLGIVGRTGAGKSTLVHLLLRLYPVPEGVISIDDEDINRWPVESLRERIGAVPQEPFLFSDTMAGNIGLGVDDPDDDAIRNAAEFAEVAADIEGFPGQFEQMVGERGVTLSGGQKQRTAIARAIVKDPTILVLDDSLSSVDARTAASIIERIQAFIADRTAILISHRIATVREAEHILVLDEGRVVESGTHEELTALDGLYADMDRRQKLSDEIEEL